MKQIIYSLTMLLMASSCDLIQSFKRKEVEPKHKKLLGFKTSFISELGDEKYDQLEEKVYKNKKEIRYINDIIYVCYLDELNACGQYDGNIEINADTIKLKLNLISDEVCTSTSIDSVTFIIDNPDKKRKVIVN